MLPHERDRAALRPRRFGGAAAFRNCNIAPQSDCGKPKTLIESNLQRVEPRGLACDSRTTAQEYDAKHIIAIRLRAE